MNVRDPFSFGSQVDVRRGQLGQPLETLLTTDNAPLQDTDRFILESAGECAVDNVNIGQSTVTYTYDALGRRIEKRHADGAATRYVYDGSRVAEEWDVSSGGSASLSASYVYGNYIDEVLTMRRGTSEYYYHGDDQHNVVKLTDNTGTVVEAYDYGDYGQPEFSSPPANPGQATGEQLDVTASPLGNPYLFTGRRWDEELGYYYFRNRYMDPALGRFVSRDPIGLWGDAANLGNGYTYAASNPWSMVDPFGLCGGNVGKPIEDVLSDFGYSWPDPNASAYNPEIEARLQQAFHDTLNDQVVWVANGVAFLPGPTGIAGEGMVAVLTGNYWTLVPVFGGQVAGGLKKISHAEFMDELVSLYGNTNRLKKELSAFERASEFGAKPFNELKNLQGERAYIGIT